MNYFADLVRSNTDFNPQNVFFITAQQFVSAVDGAKPHLQILSGSPTAVEEITQWICTYYDTDSIHIYDSLNRRHLLPEQIEFLRRLYPHQPQVVYHQVDQQPNPVDCGVFTIAFAVSILNQNQIKSNYYINEKFRSSCPPTTITALCLRMGDTYK